jgi:ATP-dependent 26S proteasome regulatory subunit
MKNTQITIADYANAGYSAIAIATADEDRSIANVVRMLDYKADIVKIAATGGLIDARTNIPLNDKAAYNSALSLAASKDDAVLILLDYQHIIRNAAAYRSLRDALIAAKPRGTMIVLIAPSWNLPPEIQHDIPVISDSLPSREELSHALDTCLKATAAVELTDATRAAILNSASGLTLGEAEGAMALAYDGTTYQPSRVADEKMKLVRQSGYLEVSAPANINDLGGLDGLRSYISAEVLPTFDDPELRVRGLMLVGVPGTGKSLAARVTGAMLNIPVLRCDIASLKGSLVGQSEQQMRAMLKLAEAVSPCVLYLDEIEKAVGGFASSAQSDGGTTLGMVGALLTWLQEHTSPIITIATCNDYSKLPAELTRAGRFDERFFVDLPSKQERYEIAAVHLARYNANGPCATAAAELSEAFTGAEIEELVRSTARRTRRNITPDALAEAAPFIRPISRVRADEINRLREWGKANLRIANTQDAPAATGRKITGKR